MSVPPSRPLSICMIVPNAHEVLADGVLDHIGGIERRIRIEAHELVRRGHETTIS